MKIHTLFFEKTSNPSAENFTALVDELGLNGTIIRFSINDFGMFMVRYNTISKLVNGDDFDMANLASIATNNGETLIAFIQSIVKRSRKIQSKNVKGQIVHSTKFRYVADVDALITDTPKGLIGVSNCNNCEDVIPFGQWRENGGLCFACSRTKQIA